MNSVNAPEPEPINNENPACWDLVINDMKERNEMGIRKYGTPLQPYNGRSFLLDTYQELLDMTVYMRGLIYEVVGNQNITNKPCAFCNENTYNLTQMFGLCDICIEKVLRLFYNTVVEDKDISTNDFFFSLLSGNIQISSVAENKDASNK